MAEDLVTYDVKLPNRNHLTVMRAIGLFLVFAGVTLGLLSGVKAFNSIGSYSEAADYEESVEAYEYCLESDLRKAWRADELELVLGGNTQYDGSGRGTACEEPDRPWWYNFEWYYSLIGIPGVIIFSYAGSRYREFFEVVHQGKIVHKDTGGGGDYALRWMLCVEGNNLANEKITQWKSVYHSTYEKKSVGDYINFTD